MKQGKKEKKRRRRQMKKSWFQALQMELREHKSSFIVFAVLRVLVLVVLARQIVQGNYESAFFCLLALALMYIPSAIQVTFRIELPPALEITVLCFIFAAEILGEVSAFYIHIPIWDTILHTVNGFLCAAVGFSMVVLLNNNERLTFDLSPLFMALVAFCFSMTIGVLWEFFEFSADYFFHTDMQKDTVVNAIYTVALDATRANRVVAVPNITDVVINGESLGLGGYLDIGIIDTMKDLFVNFIGAAVFSVTGFFYAKSKGKRRSAAQSFVPSVKDAEKDYLTQTLTENNLAPPSRHPGVPDGEAPPEETGESAEKTSPPEEETP